MLKKFARKPDKTDHISSNFLKISHFYSETLASECVWFSLLF